ncbi:MAG TPA: DUF5670 family protein [Methylomirabilota bacterium]|nr:DUF5670 family protein [Methylomirabilota bacterium]
MAPSSTRRADPCQASATSVPLTSLQPALCVRTQARRCRIELPSASSCTCTASATRSGRRSSGQTRARDPADLARRTRLAPTAAPQGSCATGEGETEEPSNEGDAMFLTLFIVLMVVWGFGWIVFRASGVLIHILLLVALISLAVHFFRGRA